MIGDSASDIQAARRANVTVVAVSYGYSRVPVEELGANFIIDRLDMLLPMIHTT